MANSSRPSRARDLWIKNYCQRMGLTRNNLLRDYEVVKSADSITGFKLVQRVSPATVPEIKKEDAQQWTDIASKYRYNPRLTCFRRHGPRCCWCGVVTKFHGRVNEPTFATIEHLIPLSKGGQNTVENRRIACWKCNHERGNDTTYFERKLEEAFNKNHLPEIPFTFKYLL